jgi:hypothetical protein
MQAHRPSAEDHPKSLFKQRTISVNGNHLGIRNASRSELRMRIITLIWSLSEAVFAEVDAFAWVQNWEIKRTWHTHTYRDRRFDALIACSACEATGKAMGRQCRTCGGSGRVNLLEPPPQSKGPGKGCDSESIPAQPAWDGERPPGALT